ncbi:MAG: hypothetical protein QOF57_2523 [Frankiaceae bacterium]|nr:hypothetical protein [Frankiaceae bacterium]
MRPAGATGGADDEAADQGMTSVSDFRPGVITVFIPTFNGERYIRECIEAVLAQHLPDGAELEVLVIDSGSTDTTCAILRSFGPRLSVHEIPNSEFSHGGTRDRAARMARGDYFLLLTQDATPASDRWLMSLIEPFSLSPLVGAVYGSQAPRANATPTIKREVTRAFASMGPRDSIVVHRHQSLVDGAPTNELDTFLSDVNAAVRRDLLIGDVPYRHVAYAEDQALARDMQTKGYVVAYAPQAAVWHSNDYSARGYFHRKFDEYSGLHDSLDQPMPVRLRSLLLGWVRPTWHDARFGLRDRDYRLLRRLLAVTESLPYNVASTLGRYYAYKYRNDPARRSKYSRLTQSAGRPAAQPGGLDRSVAD